MSSATPRLSESAASPPSSGSRSSLSSPSTRQRSSSPSLITAYIVSADRLMNQRNKFLHVNYSICVQTGTLKWTINKRYSEFASLHKSLIQRFGSRLIASLGLVMPPKSSPFSSFLDSQTAFDQQIEERKTIFNDYLKRLLGSEIVSNSVEAMAFLGMIEDHSNNKTKEADRHEIAAEAILDFLDVGDLILIRGQSRLSGLQRTFTRAEFDHVGLVTCLDPTTEVWLHDGTSRRADQLLPTDLLLGDDGQPVAIVPHTLSGTVAFPQPPIAGLHQAPWDPPGVLTLCPGPLSLRDVIPLDSSFDAFRVSHTHLVTVGTSRQARIGVGGVAVQRAQAYHFPSDTQWFPGHPNYNPAPGANNDIPGYNQATRDRGGNCNIRPYYWDPVNGHYRDPRRGAVPAGGWPNWQAALAAQIADWNQIHGLDGDSIRLGEIQADQIPLLPASIRGSRNASGDWACSIFLVKYPRVIDFPNPNDHLARSLNRAMIDVGLPTGVGPDGINYSVHPLNRIYYRASLIAWSLFHPHQLLGHPIWIQAWRSVQDNLYRDPANNHQAIFPPTLADLNQIMNAHPNQFIGWIHVVEKIANYIIDITAWIVGLWEADGHGERGTYIIQSLQTAAGQAAGIVNDHSGVFQRCRHWNDLLGLPANWFTLVPVPPAFPGALPGTHITFHLPVAPPAVAINILRRLLFRFGAWQNGLTGPQNKARIHDPTLPCRMAIQNAPASVRLHYLAGLLDGDGHKQVTEETYVFHLGPTLHDRHLLEWTCVLFRQAGFNCSRPSMIGGQWTLWSIAAHFDHQHLLPLACDYKRTVSTGLRVSNPFLSGFEIRQVNPANPPNPNAAAPAVACPPQPVVSFQVNNATGRFLLADGTITHNCKPIHSKNKRNLCLLESVGGGVRCYPLDGLLDDYEAAKTTVAVRKLNWRPDPRSLDLLDKFVDTVVGQPYSLLGLIKPKKIHVDQQETQAKSGNGGAVSSVSSESDSHSAAASDSPLSDLAIGSSAYFCSELVAFALISMNLLDSHQANEQIYLPGDFSSQSTKLNHLLAGAFYEKEVMVKFDQLEIAKAQTKAAKWNQAAAKLGAGKYSTMKPLSNQSSLASSSIPEDQKTAAPSEPALPSPRRSETGFTLANSSVVLERRIGSKTFSMAPMSKMNINSKVISLMGEEIRGIAATQNHETKCAAESSIESEQTNEHAAASSGNSSSSSVASSASAIAAAAASSSTSPISDAKTTSIASTRASFTGGAASAVAAAALSRARLSLPAPNESTHSPAPSASRPVPALLRSQSLGLLLSRPNSHSDSSVASVTSSSIVPAGLSGLLRGINLGS